MNYQKIYDQIIERAKTRQLEGYKEKHHIIPKCLGGSNDKENLVELTAREHFLCHRLLVEIYPEENKLKYALYLMNNGIVRYTKKEYTPSSRIYERLKKEFYIFIQGENSPLNKKIIQYNLNGYLLKIWPNASIAASFFGISNGDISNACKNKQNTAGGFQWKYYVKNYNININSIKIYQKPKNFNNNSPLKGKIRPLAHIKGRYRPIIQLDKNENIIKEWNSIREACIQFGENINKIESNIGACCRGKQKKAYNYIWKYKE
jgi:hypothetical protein